MIGNFILSLYIHCLTVDPCNSNPCDNPVKDNPTVCKRDNSSNMFECLCPPGYAGKRCENRKKKIMNS